MLHCYWWTHAVLLCQEFLFFGQHFASKSYYIAFWSDGDFLSDMMCEGKWSPDTVFVTEFITKERISTKSELLGMF